MTEVRTTSLTGGQKGVKLQRFELVPVGPLTELAEHYGRGARKYAEHQWRQGYEWSKSYAAIQRHLTAFWAGEDYDVCPENGEGCKHTTDTGEPFIAIEPNTCYNHTGSHHMTAVAWHAFALLEFKDRYPQHDDRYKADPLEGFDIDYNHVAVSTHFHPDDYEFEVLERYLSSEKCHEHDDGEPGARHVYLDGPHMTPKICNPERSK